MARPITVRDDYGNVIVKTKSKIAPAKKAALRRDSTAGSSKASKAITPRGDAKVSAKSLKSQAIRLAAEASPVRYLGMKHRKQPARLSRLVEEGLPTRTADYLAGNLDIPVVEFMAKYVHIPKQTMARR